MTTINELREKIRQLEKQLSERKTLDRKRILDILATFQTNIIGAVTDCIGNGKSLNPPDIDKIAKEILEEKDE